MSRVGGSAQIKAMKKVASPLRLAYSQYRELQAFAQFGSDLDNDTKSRLAQGERIVEVLKQDKNSPIPVEQQVVIIFAVINNLLTEIPVSDIARFESELYEHMEAAHDDILADIRETGVLTDENSDRLKTIITDLKNRFISNSFENAAE